MCQSKKYQAPESVFWNRYCSRKSEVDSYMNQKDEIISKPAMPIDMWSLGCVLLELFSGEQLFSSISLQDLNQAVGILCM